MTPNALSQRVTQLTTLQLIALVDYMIEDAKGDLKNITGDNWTVYDAVSAEIESRLGIDADGLPRVHKEIPGYYRELYVKLRYGNH
ncbi:hypothetical protein [Nesterenkonia rhizosphaerae]|uniref:Uncharacterized protein n=1 Tax=Nesterenkonia rhizosphaerae TaxID=1348272 RepID=A0ABP9FT00_9MICC